jgi:hypothetical protein
VEGYVRTSVQIMCYGVCKSIAKIVIGRGQSNIKNEKTRLGARLAQQVDRKIHKWGMTMEYDNGI